MTASMYFILMAMVIFAPHFSWRFATLLGFAVLAMGLFFPFSPPADQPNPAPVVYTT